jgi:hypothetical protein
VPLAGVNAQQPRINNVSSTTSSNPGYPASIAAGMLDEWAIMTGKRSSTRGESTAGHVLIADDAAPARSS